MVGRLTGDVQRGNAALRIAEALTTLLGPACGGVLLALFGVPAGFIADSASYAISALCLMLIGRQGKGDERKAASAAAPLWRALAEGWQEFRSRPWLWRVIAFWALHGCLVFGPALPLTAVAVVETHGTGGYALITSAFGGGAVLGGALALRLRPARPLAYGSLAVSAFAAAPLAVAADAPPWLLVLAHLVGGAGFAFWGVMWATTLQTAVPAAVLGRVAAYDVGGSILALPIGRAVAGPAAELVGLRTLLYGIAVLALAIPALMLANPAIRRFRPVAEDVSEPLLSPAL
jgi:hypothetical protein